ncbi:enoyl-CoA hydratase-related protein [Arthrobacter sp. K5]|uniref:Enoyl-CoA hydratase-related protein n=1 Tax=Arthrobacter sp. K5 TaxID=2839623 RepID=A0AAU8EWU1_9MICC
MSETSTVVTLKILEGINLPAGIAVELQGRVLHVIFDRPERKNAMNLQMWQVLPRIIHLAEGNDQVRAIAFSGRTADSFSAGADISEFSTVRSGAANSRHYSAAVQEAELAIIECTKPTLALVRGWCVGGGCELALACDIRIGDTTAKMGITPAKLGIVYSQTSTTRLVEEVGAAWARLLLLTGEIVKADTALRISLLHEVHLTEDVEARWNAVLGRVTGGAPVTRRRQGPGRPCSSRSRAGRRRGEFLVRALIRKR